ncbi:phage antirepressor Ant [Actinomyces sp. 432]|uniref:phage antirepressor n=1 Tax=Actinomyces sp. 432 TaxID=2057798 RepID=UPI00137461DD|nr:phage antirepressor [Actinomyces sp. 432]QHO91959.1 phage antirepressor Ant [Actinomyces sp. 432]
MSGIITEADVPNVNSGNAEADAPSLFDFDGQNVRVIVIDGAPWFVLADLCKVLGLTSPAKVAERLGDGVSRTHPIQDSLGRTQQATIVNESGMYRVILRSDKPDALKFQAWITDEVLPSIRQRGGYLTPAAVEKALTDPDFIIGLATSLKEERAKRAALEAQVEEDRPHTRLGKAISASGGELLVKQVADAITQEGVPVNQAQLFRWLRGHGWLCRNQGALWNAPTKWALERGYVRSVVTLITTGHGEVEKTTPKITGPGQADLIEGFTTGRYTLDEGVAA